MIGGIQIDSREPTWIQQLKFNGIPTVVEYMEHGDLMAACDDGTIIYIERKTPDDFLGSLKDGRLFPQLAPLCSFSRWSYLMITGDLQRGTDDKVITDRGVTGWSWKAVQGAILSIQEMGVMVTFCAGDSDYEAAVLRLGNRNHEDVINLVPPRFPRVISNKEAIIAALPGIGIERLPLVMEAAGNNPSVALQILTDPQCEIPGVPKGIKNRIRNSLMLSDKTQFLVSTNKNGEEVLTIEPIYLD